MYQVGPTGRRALLVAGRATAAGSANVKTHQMLEGPPQQLGTFAPTHGKST